MKMLLRSLLLLFAFTAHLTLADSRVFTLITPNPEAVVQQLRNTYGDKIQADVVQGRLFVVGSQQQLDEIAALLVKIDPSPRALRLTVREQPPADATPGTIVYSTDTSGYTIDTVESALVAIDYNRIVQQPSNINRQSSNSGWWIAIDNVPTQFNTLTLQVRTEGGRRAIVSVNYTKEQNQERRVFGNTVVGEFGTWIPLLPRPANDDPNTISSGPKRGDQLYLRVEKNFDKKR